MGKRKTKVIQKDLHMFTHIQVYSGMTYSGITQAYSSVYRTLCNPGISRTLVYYEVFSEPWHI